MPLAAVVDGHIFCTHGGIPEERKYDQVGFKRAVNNIPGNVYENRSPLKISTSGSFLVHQCEARGFPIFGPDSGLQNKRSSV